MDKQLADRQGDVILVHQNLDPTETLAHYARVPMTPALKKKGRFVLAEGEVTGHAHTIEKTDFVELLRPSTLPAGQALLVVSEVTVQRGSFIEGRVLEQMPGGTIRFKQTDGVVIRFQPGDIQVVSGGVKVERAYIPLTHDEHDAIPVSKGVYHVIQHQTAEARGRTLVAD